MLSDFSFSENTVGFLVEGSFSQETASKLIATIESKLDFYDTINLYIEDTGIEHFSLKALADEILFKFKHSERFNKVALVTDRKWLQACNNLLDVFGTTNARNFATEDRLKALSWIME
jgi:hypothetical protein